MLGVFDILKRLWIVFDDAMRHVAGFLNAGRDATVFPMYIAKKFTCIFEHALSRFGAVHTNECKDAWRKQVGGNGCLLIPCVPFMTERRVRDWAKR